MIGSIVTALYVAGIVAAIHAVMTTQTPTAAVAWSVSLLSMPPAVRCLRRKMDCARWEHSRFRTALLLIRVRM